MVMTSQRSRLAETIPTGFDVSLLFYPSTATSGGQTVKAHIQPARVSVKFFSFPHHHICPLNLTSWSTSNKMKSPSQNDTHTCFPFSLNLFITRLSGEGLFLFVLLSWGLKRPIRWLKCDLNLCHAVITCCCNGNTSRALISSCERFRWRKWFENRTAAIPSQMNGMNGTVLWQTSKIISCMQSSDTPIARDASWLWAYRKQQNRTCSMTVCHCDDNLLTVAVY